MVFRPRLKSRLIFGVFSSAGRSFHITSHHITSHHITGIDILKIFKIWHYHWRDVTSDVMKLCHIFFWNGSISPPVNKNAISSLYLRIAIKPLFSMESRSPKPLVTKLERYFIPVVLQTKAFQGHHLKKKELGEFRNISLIDTANFVWYDYKDYMFSNIKSRLHDVLLGDGVGRHGNSVLGMTWNCLVCILSGLFLEICGGTWFGANV